LEKKTEEVDHENNTIAPDEAVNAFKDKTVNADQAAQGGSLGADMNDDGDASTQEMEEEDAEDEEERNKPAVTQEPVEEAHDEDAKHSTKQDAEEDTEEDAEEDAEESLQDGVDVEDVEENVENENRQNPTANSSDLTADPLSFLMAQTAEAEVQKPEKAAGSEFVDDQASEEEDVYDYGSDEHDEDEDVNGDVEGLVTQEKVEMTAEEAEAVAQFGAGQEEAEDEKRIKEVLAVTRGERRHGRRGQYKRSGMREGLLEEEDDDSSESEGGDDDEIEDGTESDESDGGVILGEQNAEDNEAGSDQDDWDEEKRRRLRLRRERLRRQELQDRGAPELVAESQNAVSLLQTDEDSQAVWNLVNKTNVSRTASLGGLSRTASLGGLSRTASFSGIADENSVSGPPNKMRRHGSFLGLSAAKRTKAAAMAGTGNSLLAAGRNSFVFVADDSCSNLPEETPGTAPSNSSSRLTKTVSMKHPKRHTKPDTIKRAGQQLFRSLSAPVL